MSQASHNKGGLSPPRPPAKRLSVTGRNFAFSRRNAIFSPHRRYRKQSFVCMPCLAHCFFLWRPRTFRFRVRHIPPLPRCCQCRGLSGGKTSRSAASGEGLPPRSPPCLAQRVCRGRGRGTRPHPTNMRLTGPRRLPCGRRPAPCRNHRPYGQRTPCRFQSRKAPD